MFEPAREQFKPRRPDAERRLTGAESLQEKGRVVQHALDVNYLPLSLLIDGEAAGRLEDYWAIVARLAARWPVRSGS
jgi:hypothetical protein